MRALFRHFRRSERGGALALVGTMMVLLVGMTAFGTDLAWWYLNASRIQRTADAAALAGVVWLPGDDPAAKSTALDLAMRNGYDNADAAVEVTTTSHADDPVAYTPNQLNVHVRAEVPTFFTKIFGFNSIHIARSATAEYVPPLKLGSPANCFGNDPQNFSTDPDCAGFFWANIHGRNTDTRMGDAYSSFCRDNSGSTNSCPQNPYYRNTGYLYGVIPNGSSFTLETLDMTFHNKLGPVNNGDFHRTGDHNNFCGSPSCVGPTVTVRIYAPDPTPLDLSDNGAPLCSKTYSPQNQVNPDDDPPFDYVSDWQSIGKGWDTVCTVNGTAADGIYVVQIANTSSNINTSGLNRYAIRTNSAANLFGLGDFSMFNNTSASISNFYLAEVPDYYAGKTFVIELYDPGDSASGGDIQLRDPSGGIFPSCEMYTRTGDVNPETWTHRASLSPCQFTALNNGGSNDYNGDWVRLEADLPASYSCTDCWWRITYDFVGGVQDTTTWRAFMIGNPIHLVP